MRYKGWDVEVKQFQYGNGRIALCLAEIDTGEPIAIASVNMPGLKLDDDEIVIKNYNENEGMLEFLISNNIVTKPHQFVKCGYVQCGVVRLK